MSLKKYLVNAQTKILEFKRKHNFLSEKVYNFETGNMSGIDLKVKTIRQSNANDVLNFSSVVPSTLTAGLVYSPKYCRFEEINGVLYIIWNFALENPTESAIQVNWLRLTVDLNENMATKIYDFQNKTVKENNQGIDICAFSLFGGSQSYPHDLASNSHNAVIKNGSAYKLSLNVYIPVKVDPTKDMWCSGRIALTLI